MSYKKIRILLYSDGVYEGHKKGHLGYFDNIFEKLKEKFEIEEIWVGANGGEYIGHYEPTVSLYNIFSYKNSFDALQKISPDIVLVPNSNEYISRTLLIAAKLLSIPTAIIYSGTPFFGESGKIVRLKTRIIQSFSIPVKGRSMMGVMFIKKYYFVVKTLLKCRFSLIKILSYILNDFKDILSTFISEFKSDDSDLYICCNNQWMEYALSKGIKKEKIVVVGEIALDPIYKKISSLKKINHDKIQVIVLTSPVVEHGFWTKKFRDKWVSDLIKALIKNFKDEIELKFKIHPTSESLEEYQEIIWSLDKKIEILQKEDLIEHINNCDLVITNHQTTALIQVLLLKKPIIIYNPFKVTHYYLQKEVAIECNTINDIVIKIEKKNFLHINKEKNDKFVEEIVFRFDGKCSERAAEQLVILLNRKQKI